VWATARSGIALAWVALYAGADRLAQGELDWWLNARGRWLEFARRAADIAPAAAVYHGHDLGGVGAAVAAHARHDGAALVYDAHELYVESGSLANRSRTLKYLLKRLERVAYRRADAVITVNMSIARELQARYGPRNITVIYNCATPAESRSVNRIRTALGLPSHCRIALYQGAFTEVRGLREVAAAVRKPGLESVHLVFMGFGPMQGELEAEARLHAQIHVLPPVLPTELDTWVASADACVMTNLPAGLNELMSTPNKLFESIAAGVPVITSDFPERRAIVLDSSVGRLGAVCNPTDPESIADAMRSVLLADAAEMAGMRGRCLDAARQRWNWRIQERELLGLYASLPRAQRPASRQLARGRAA
jgi:glycosyltransferase involved in cell wall biosynthesis